MHIPPKVFLDSHDALDVWLDRFIVLDLGNLDEFLLDILALRRTANGEKRQKVLFLLQLICQEGQLLVATCWWLPSARWFLLHKLLAIMYTALVRPACQAF